MSSTILLIHGLFGHLRPDRILAAFKDARVLAPDLLGYGEYRSANTSGLTLAKQADHVAALVQGQGDERVHVVGHSVGGAVAVLLADRHPGLVESLTSVEGNFTLDDAFWTRRIARMEPAEVESIIAGYRKDASGWLASAGVPATPWTRAVAAEWLNHQPASTIRAQAAAVVRATQECGFPAMVERLMAAGLPVHLVAGARSRAAWSVPEAIVRRATSHTLVPETGHLMMLEKPEDFARAIQGNLGGKRKNPDPR